MARRAACCGMLVMLASTAACETTSCGARPRRLDFADLGLANRIDVVGLGNEKVATITDPSKIQAAVAFIERYHDGWIDVWSGPKAPSLDFFFYQDDRLLGEFGIASDYIVVGGLSRDAPATEITAVAARLGLQWPPGR